MSIQQQKERGCDVIPMHLIDEAIIFRVDTRFAGQKFREHRGASRSVDPRQARDDAAATEH